uniref:Conotoxin n=1 Tax=Conus episcopatus TaxID=88764 RepID=A0A0K2S853_CONEP|nr:Conotoxin Superfamily T [Conus episcopatus]
MRCLPVFIVLLLLIVSAPGFDARPKTEDDVPLSSFHEDLQRTVRTLLDIRKCCFDTPGCCPWG